MLEDYTALLLDLNSTFMFGEDRFGENEDFSKHYHAIGGKCCPEFVNNLIRKVYDYLLERYPKAQYRHCFPSLSDAIDACSGNRVAKPEKERLIETFAYHEHGEIPKAYVQTLKRLKEQFTLSLVVDIWAPKDRWVTTLENQGLWRLFSASSFSSDHGMVKPSPRPFEYVVNELGLAKEKCLVIGDSIRRDLGGAEAAGLDCVLVGGATSDKARDCHPDLIDFQRVITAC